MRSGIDLRRVALKQKVHIVRDNDHFEYSRALCGVKSIDAWGVIEIPSQEQDEFIDGDGFCLGCRNVVRGILNDPRFGGRMYAAPQA